MSILEICRKVNSVKAERFVAGLGGKLNLEFTRIAWLLESLKETKATTGGDEMDKQGENDG